jgi:hypothetical protein
MYQNNNMNSYRPYGGQEGPPLFNYYDRNYQNYEGRAEAAAPPPPPPPPLLQQQRMSSSSNTNSKPSKCMACDLWFNSYEVWISHLTSEAHQRTAARPYSAGNLSSHEGWSEASSRYKCLIVSGVRGLGIGQLALYLSKWGAIGDLVRQQDRTVPTSVECYYVLYENEYVEQLK